MAEIDEAREKERRARELMLTEGVDALALSTVGNFAWVTCGADNYVSTAAETGAATALITAEAKYIVCDNIEEPRLRDERLEDQGFEFRTFGWSEGNRDELVSQLCRGMSLGSDVPIAGAKNAASAFDPCRWSLMPEEVDRFRWLGTNTGECLAQACRELEPGMTEHKIAALLDGKLLARGITPVVTLIAVDDRISRYRHPLPTNAKLQRYAMLVTGARRWGLIVSTTRLVHFGEPPPEIRCKHHAVTRIDGVFITHTVPGANVRDVFRKAVGAYAETGYPEEWKLHHQGGPTGYKGREFRANAQTEALVRESQAFAWNPSITGTKSEDTIIASSSGPEMISWIRDWPALEVEIDGITLNRPDILVR